MRKLFYIFFLIILVGLGIYIYKLTTYTYVTAKFSELRPIHEKLPVYYKGLVIGKAREQRHSDDFNHTLIRLVLYPKNLLLPDNTTVLLKKEKHNDKERDFLELVYPKEPSNIMIANGSIIEGKATVDIDEFMKNQNADDLEAIRHNLAQSSENLNNAIEGLSMVFESVNEILKENQKNLYTTTGNLSKATQNLDNMTSKFNKSIQQKNLENAVSNLEASTKNLETMSENLTGTTSGVNEVIPHAEATMCQVQGLAANANAISCGIRKTLRKRFGGLRLLFGKVIDECDKPACR